MGEDFFEEFIRKKRLAVEIKQLLYTTFGTFVNLKVNFWLHELKENVGIIEVNKNGLPLLRVVLTFLHTIDGEKVMINDLLVSGTLKKLKDGGQEVDSWIERWPKEKEAITSIEGIKEDPSVKFSPLERMREKLQSRDGSAGI